MMDNHPINGYKLRVFMGKSAVNDYNQQTTSHFIMGNICKCIYIYIYLYVLQSAVSDLSFALPCLIT